MDLFMHHPTDYMHYAGIGQCNDVQSQSYNALCFMFPLNVLPGFFEKSVYVTLSM